MALQPLRLVELYAGIARSSQPFLSWPRCSLSLLVDNDSLAVQTYVANFPKAPYLFADLTGVSAREIEALAGGRVDILLGCPPCQGFSDTGVRNPHDGRNSHLSLFGNLAIQLRPMAVAMENVPLAGRSGRFWSFAKKMENVGYLWTAGIVNAALRGSAQSRQRLVFIAIRKDVGAAPVIPDPDHGESGSYYSYASKRMMTVKEDPIGMLGATPATMRIRKLMPYNEEKLGAAAIPTVAEVFDGLPTIGTREAKSLDHLPWNHTSKQLRRMGAVPEGGRWAGGDDHFAQSYGRLHRKGLARTVTTYFSNPGSGRFWHPTQNRAITLREAARLQGIPDSFSFMGPRSNAATLVGNALDAAIANLVYRVVRESFG